MIAQHTFVVLSYILNDLGWGRMFIDGTPKLFELSLEMDDKIQKYLPRIHEKLEQDGYNSSLLFAEGLLTVFSAKTNY